MISFEQFEESARDFNVIPLVIEILADIETPISIAVELEKKGKYFLLEALKVGKIGDDIQYLVSISPRNS